MDLFDQVILEPDRSARNTTVGRGNLLEGLNPQQAEAVRHVSGPLLILAGAGSGKTRVITHRIAWLVAEKGVKPSSILAITFTNKAAAEMKQRVEELVGPESHSMWIGTFHAMMVRVLRRFADRIGYERSFAILDSDDQQRVVKSCLAELNLPDKTFVPRAVHSQISSAKNSLTGAADFAREAGNDYRLSKIAAVYRLYQHKLRKANSMDFDDILFESVRLFRDNADVLAEFQERFNYVMVDEYQDTNHAQYELVRMLSARHRNLCVVGDDDQSIYSFRGANIQNILDFEKDFKGCKVIKLEQNYRSTGTVLEAANAVIKGNIGRKAKKLWTSSGQGEPITFLRADSHSEEGRYIASEISRLASRSNCSQPYREIAILYRLNALSRNLEFALREQGVPYRIFGGTRFYDRKEIRDMLAWLRLIMSPTDDLSLARAIQTPKRGIGEATLAQLEAIAASEELSQLEVCKLAANYPGLQRPSSRLQGFAAQVEAFRRRLFQNDLEFAEYIEWIQNESGLIQELVDQRDKSKENDPVDRIENLKELLSDAVEFENHLRRLEESEALAGLPPEDRDLPAEDLHGVLGSYLERAALYSEMDEDRENQDYVRLMTIHSAKGLEFGTVFLIGAEEGLFPGYRANESEAAIEEERRLAYVAITRAKNKLYITTARSRLVFGQTQSMPVSRFIREIPDKLVDEIGGSRRGDRTSAMLRDDGPTPGSAARHAGMPLPNRAAVRTDASFPGAADISAQRTAAPAAEAIDLRKGDRIRHAKFGPGRIVSLEPVAGDAILVIEFQSGEIKRLMARMARLDKI